MSKIKFYTTEKDVRILHHGNQYVDVNQKITLCPECCSDNVDGSISYGDYKCKDCGCVFCDGEHIVRTKIGIIEVALRILTVLLLVAAFALFFIGIAYCVKSGDDNSVKTILTAIGITLGGPVVCSLLACGADELRKCI